LRALFILLFLSGSLAHANMNFVRGKVSCSGEGDVWAVLSEPGQRHKVLNAKNF
jgi:hypothetical protein